ncbi:MAG: UDP-N-acetylmuramoyl-tripeptide--D-alanyl-D-alanine ligase [Candidatus Colwellbacteria bacterium]
MKSLALKIINWKLGLIAKYTLRRYRPKVIGVTGSVGKTSTKGAIYAVLSGAKIRVRMAGGNLNNETGLPLAIIGDYQKPGGFWFLAGAIWSGFWKLMLPSGGAKYPEVLILEYAADHPGDLDYLIKIARPDVAVVTAIGDIPVHSEFYSSTDEVAKEKAKLVEAVPSDGLVILNADDPRVLGMKNSTGALVKTFGFNKGADLVVDNLENTMEGGALVGISFSLESSGIKSDVNLTGIVGKPHAYACAAGAVVGLAHNLSLPDINKWLSSYSGERGRGKIIAGANNTTIIDESYNAAPDSTRAALETLIEIPSKRRIAVLGDMLELGGRSEEAHTLVGSLITNKIGLLITVGGESRFMNEGAIQKGFNKANAFHFDSAQEAGDYLKNYLEEGDIVLIKGSQSIRMEKMIEKIMLEPANAHRLLVRQYGKWLSA